MNHQNNYVQKSNMMSNTANNFDNLATSLDVLHNYFDGSLKLFSDLY